MDAGLPRTTLPTDTFDRAIAFVEERRLLVEVLVIAGALVIFLASVLPNLANHPAITDDEIWVLSASYKLAEEGIFGSDMFAGFYNAIAGNALINVLFMVGLLGIGLALILGIGMRVAAISGTIMYVMMWAAELPIVTNPFLDDHLTGAMTLIVLALTAAGATWGLGTWWAHQSFVQKNRWLI